MTVLSVIVGGSAWNQLPRMFEKMDFDLRSKVLHFLNFYIAVLFCTDVSLWFEGNWQYLDESVLLIMKYFKT